MWLAGRVDARDPREVCGTNEIVSEGYYGKIYKNNSIKKYGLWVRAVRPGAIARAITLRALLPN